jgi:RNA polymerase sigma factor (sigma-70 family)
MTRSDFNDYVQQQSRKLYGYAFRILRKQEEAEDAVQEVFIKLWKMKEKLGEYRSIDALATTMTKNYCIDQLRKDRNIVHDGNTKQYHNYVTSPSPHEQMVITETNEILHRIIEHLPEGYRDMIRLRDIEGLPYEEIAEHTGQNINTLRVTLSRARKLIRDEYNKYQDE